MKSFQEEFADIKQLCESERYIREIDATWEQLSKNPIILYGAGAVGVDVASTLMHYGIKVLCFCDKYKTGIQKDTGLPIVSPQLLLTEYKDAMIIISTIYYADEIKNELRSLGISKNRIFAKFFLNIHTLNPGDVYSILDGYERAYGLFDDMKSKKVITGRLKCYMTMKPLIPVHMTPLAISPLKSQYFEKNLITLRKDEVFVDGGMYTGDTADIFVNLTNGEYKHYYGFEPDGENYSKATINLANRSNMTLVKKGLYSSVKTLRFNDNFASSSGISVSDGGSIINVTSIDTYFTGINPPTFIKMDIEGAELDALKGSGQIIRTYKPKLAICAYHKLEDIFTLPELIKKYRDDYKFYLRHYTNSLNETVLYAV